MKKEKRDKGQRTRKYNLLSILIIIFISFVLYANTLKNDFVYDDIECVVNNEEIRNFSNVLHLSPAERPIRTISLMLDYALYKLNPTGYHLTNLILHILCSILVYLFALGIGYRVQGAGSKNSKSHFLLLTSYFPLIVALLFAVHPIHTEAVAGVANRKEMLCMLFFMLSLILYIKATQSRNQLTNKPTNKLSFYIGSIISFILALLSKQVAIVLPVIIIFYDLYFKNKNSQLSTLNSKLITVFYYIPYFVVIIIGYLLSIKEIQQLFVNIKEWGIPYSHILLTIPCAIVKYLRLLVLPYNLCADYFFPMAMSIEPRVIVSIIIIIGLIILIFKVNRILSFGILWIFITLLPILNIVPANYVVAERYLYISTVGFCMVVAWLLCNLIAKRRLLGITILTLILLAYCGLTIRRNFDWRDNYTLWAKTVRQNPMSLPAHNNLGIIYMRNGFHNKALQEFNKVLEINPDDLFALNNLGIIYVKLECYKDAINVFKKLLAKRPDDARAHYNLGIIYMRKGMFEEALSEYETTIKINPYFREAYEGLWHIYKKLGKEKEATQAYGQYMRLEG